MTTETENKALLNALDEKMPDVGAPLAASAASNQPSQATAPAAPETVTSAAPQYAPSSVNLDEMNYDVPAKAASPTLAQANPQDVDFDKPYTAADKTRDQAATIRKELDGTIEQALKDPNLTQEQKDKLRDIQQNVGRMNDAELVTKYEAAQKQAEQTAQGQGQSQGQEGPKDKTRDVLSAAAAMFPELAIAIAIYDMFADEQKKNVAAVTPAAGEKTAEADKVTPAAGETPTAPPPEKKLKVDGEESNKPIATAQAHATTTPPTAATNTGQDRVTEGENYDHEGRNHPAKQPKQSEPVILRTADHTSTKGLPPYEADAAKQEGNEMANKGVSMDKNAPQNLTMDDVRAPTFAGVGKTEERGVA